MDEVDLLVATSEEPAADAEGSVGIGDEVVLGEVGSDVEEEAADDGGAVDAEDDEDAATGDLILNPCDQPLKAVLPLFALGLLADGSHANWWLPASTTSTSTSSIVGVQAMALSSAL